MCETERLLIDGSEQQLEAVGMSTDEKSVPSRSSSRHESWRTHDRISIVEHTTNEQRSMINEHVLQRRDDLDYSIFSSTS